MKAPSPARARAGRAAALALAAAFGAGGAAAQNLPVSPQQRATAEQVAQAGVPLAELAPDAPGQYTVQRGDTLWSISGLFLRSPWRWPELWGMNLEQVRNPHRIYPGQLLVLEQVDGRARLRLAAQPAQELQSLDTVRLGPRTRAAPLADTSIPTLPPQAIEPFLQEAIIVGEGELERAPRIVAAPEERVLLTRGDRAYARGRNGAPLQAGEPGQADQYRVFRSAVPLRDPLTRQVLGYEARYLGSARLVRGESVQPVPRARGGSEPAIVPATIDIVRAKEEMRVGDRLLPEPPRELASYTPRAPAGEVDGSIVSVTGDAVALAGQNQVVVINKGLADGIENGHVLAILQAGRRLDDRSQPGERANLKLPDERNGLLMVFRAFDRLSYALVLQITDTVAVGDRVATPR